MEYSNPSLGITEPITSEITCKDVVYKDGKPIRGIITLKSEKDASYYDGVYQDKVYIKCIQKDDMAQHYPLLEEADTLIFVSPVYWFNLGGQIKQFIDRCYALAGKKMEDGTICFSHKRMGLVLAHEGDDPFDSGGINAIRSIQDTCAYLDIPFVGALYGCALDEGEMEKNTAMIEKAKAYGASL